MHHTTILFLAFKEETIWFCNPDYHHHGIIPRCHGIVSSALVYVKYKFDFRRSINPSNNKLIIL